MKNIINALRRFSYSIITVSFLLMATGCSYSEHLRKISVKTDKVVFEPFQNCCIYRKEFSQGSPLLRDNYTELKLGMTTTEVSRLIGPYQSLSILNKNRHEHIFQKREEGFGKLLKILYVELIYKDKILNNINIIKNEFDGKVAESNE